MMKFKDKLILLAVTIVPNILAVAQLDTEALDYLDIDTEKIEVLTNKRLAGESYLLGRAYLDAKTFSQGPTSGLYLGEGPINSQTIPFINKQPVQGFSSVYNNGDGTFLAMADNGFGSIENSADYHLRVYTIKPRFKSWKYGRQDIKVLDFIELHDPEKHIPFAITNHFSTDRVLTGADFDIESFQIAADGSYWFGDEFGPFLIHTDPTGKVLEEPIALPDFEIPGRDIKSPQNPFNEESSAIRVMNAMRVHAFTTKGIAPVFSPWHVLLNDKDKDTYAESRKIAPAGLQEASSEIFDVNSIKKAGFPVVVWTVNDTPRMKDLMDLQVDGIISDRPDYLWEAVKNYDGNNDGTPDFLDNEGLIDINKFDAQGHRGGRNLRPENTLPAMEVALDFLMTTLETDCGLTKDGVAVLSHDPYLQASKVKKADDTPYEVADEVLIKDLTLHQLQNEFIADKILPNRPDQTNDRTLSPVAVSFTKAQGMLDAYTIPTLNQLFKFVDFYVAYYKTGEGKNHPNATKRWKNAQRVRFNIETKINPRSDTDHKGNTFKDRTFNAPQFAQVIGATIVQASLTERADVQSFDFTSLLEVQKKFPQIRTVCLFGDFPKYDGEGSDDGTNLQDENGNNTPWLAGMYWPYRSTQLTSPFKAKQSGGFEGMAYNTNEEKLYPLLEKPLVGSPDNELIISEFDLATKRYTNKQFKYKMNERAAAIGEFVLFDGIKGLIIERDNSQGDMNGFKAIYEINLDSESGMVKKRLAADLLNISDPLGASSPDVTGDVGLGSKFGFPFVTIESVIYLNPYMVGVLNDNNYPFSVGRHVGDQLPDDNEFVILFLTQPLGKPISDELSLNNKPKSSVFAKFSVSPNPFSTSTTFSFNCSENQLIKIVVFNGLGQEIKTITVNGQGTNQQIVWDGKDKEGKKVVPGIYYAVLDGSKKAEIVKFIKSE